MGRAPCCETMGVKKGPWTPEEDKILVSHIEKNGHGNWRALPKLAGLLRCGKSCRLRWINYLRPDIKRGNFTQKEEETIIKLHEMLGNRWSAIAARLPGRTDNEIKNVWHTHLKKKIRNNPSDTLHDKWQPRKPVTSNGGSENIPMSPLASSEGTSVLDLSTVTAGVSNEEINREEMDPIQIPVIDENFWSDDMDSFSVLGNNLSSDLFDWMEPESMLSDLLIKSPGQIGEEKTDFWYDLLISTGAVPEVM